MALEYYISDFFIFCYNFIGKKGERKKIDLPRCPFEKIRFFCPEGAKMMLLHIMSETFLKMTFS